MNMAMTPTSLQVQAPNFMTLKIDRARAQIRPSGKFRSEHMDQVNAEIDLSESPVILDLEEVV